MNQSHFVRKMDELGRLVIPIEIRKILEINEKDPLGIFLENGGIFIKKIEPHCIFCNSNISIIPFENKNICKNCLKKLNNLK